MSSSDFTTPTTGKLLIEKSFLTLIFFNTLFNTQFFLTRIKIQKSQIFHKKWW